MVVVVAACGGAATVPPAPVARTQDGIVVLDRAPPDALELHVRAIRWACTVTYPDDIVAPELKVPVGRAIKLIVATPESPENVQGLEVSLVGTAVKKPIVKDAPVEIVFRIVKPGTYQWKCPTLVPPPPRELLDADTAVSADAIAQQNPLKPLTAMVPADYAAMLAAAADPSDPVTFGSKLYLKKGCAACHTIDGTPRVGPSWKGIWGTEAKLSDGTTRTVDADYVNESILHPQAFARPGYPPAMPSFEGQLRDRELAAIIAFIASLK